MSVECHERYITEKMDELMSNVSIWECLCVCVFVCAWITKI